MDPLEPQLPGEDLVREGPADLFEGKITECGLLVLVVAPRLRGLGLTIPDVPHVPPAEHRLYEKLEERLGPGAHSYYNSLLRRIVSYARALEHDQTASPKL